MAKSTFKRTDPQVQEDAVNLTLEEFQAKYKDQAQAVILKTVWNAAQKNKANVAEKTNEGNDLPAGPTEDAVTETGSYIAEDGAKVTTFEAEGGVKGAEIDNEPKEAPIEKIKKTKGGSKKAANQDPNEQPSGTTKPEGQPTRAERIRALIAEGTSKADVQTKLKEEGYDVKTFHSEWNRLNKPKA